jgi:hypothetical protein
MYGKSNWLSQNLGFWYTWHVRKTKLAAPILLFRGKGCSEWPFFIASIIWLSLLARARPLLLFTRSAGSAVPALAAAGGGNGAACPRAILRRLPSQWYEFVTPWRGLQGWNERPEVVFPLLVFVVGKFQ